MTLLRLHLFSLLSFFFFANPTHSIAQEKLTVADDINAFASSFYAHTNQDTQKNSVCSPYSIFTCLSMTYVGASGETASEMAKALHVTLPQKQLGSSIKKLSDDLKAKNDELSYELNIANAMWLDKDTVILSDYRHVMQTEFDAKVEALDFSNGERSTSIINEWISNQTQGKIPRLLTQSDVSKLTRLLLTNAVYFKGSWTKPFGKDQSGLAPFHVDTATSHDTSMMQQTESFPYFENNDMQMLCMPFMGISDTESRMACFILLPKTSSSLKALESSLDRFSFQTWIDGLETHRIQAKIPSFTVDTKIDLKSILKSMGIQEAFTTDANFSGIDGMQDLFVDKAIHQAFFALNEDGVTAAAATGVSMGVKSMPPAQIPPISFTADHPFLFGIVDLKSKVMLFLGKIVDPNSGS